ncbi:MAG: GYD domain-containing protein [candidate division NC10 bacterium]|nr:GYD domain-containing protein [candidate division NC10 bacterium]MCH7897081.1 GYD domain-containing protein [candidate division NC10 bacterium]MCZ6551722.1 GYD domain-containing protein [candidate division NC10 bacterium]
MPTYVILGKYTLQGIRKIKGTTKRADAFRNLAKKMGVRVKEIYWTMGQYDVVTIIDAPDDATATRVLLAAGSMGNVQTETLRAYTQNEVARILKGI